MKYGGGGNPVGGPRGESSFGAHNGATGETFLAQNFLGCCVVILGAL